MTPSEFIRKWERAALTERAAAQSHFLDLCKVVGHDDPVTADPKGEWFTFEKGVTKSGGGDGFADVWKRNHFAWEYKRKKRDLDQALGQLVRYAAALENPPLQVACDTDRFLIQTAWTNAIPQRYEIALEDLSNPAKFDILHSVFFDPEKLRPKKTRAAVTKEAADKFSTIASRLQGRGTPEEIAHFVNQLVFCFFADSVKLLPAEFFPKLLARAAAKPEKARDYFDRLFAAMEKGGEFDLTDIAWFNGGLFDGRRALGLDYGDILLLQQAVQLDWSQIDPTIFGTLFERFLDFDKRAQIGAHYTDPDKIMMIVEPVILRPLREEWTAAKAEIEGYLAGSAKPPMRAKVKRRMTPAEAAEEVRSRYLERLRALSILDPACGSGNFLYLALQGVKDIENKANLECESLGLPSRLPMVGPEILHGIEINPLAAELARTTIWIGDIQWRRRNGIYSEPPPILRKLDAIECRDALVKVAPSSSLSPGGGEGRGEGAAVGESARERGRGESPLTLPSLPEGERDSVLQRGRGSPETGHGEGVGQFVEAEWPAADFIVGNPPFLGGKLMRRQMSDEDVDRLFEVYDGRVPPEADLVCYWFEKARAQLRLERAKRIGLVATNSIRGGANRKVLDRIVGEGVIFEAWSDEPWVIDGASVRVSLICFGKGSDQPLLDGKPASRINSDLTAGDLDLTKARRLDENLGVSFMGDTKGGAFDVSGDVARNWLRLPANPNGRTNTDVLRPWRNGLDITRRSADKWIVDFGWEMSESEAALYEAPFEHIKERVLPERSKNRRESYRKHWWRHVEPRPALVAKLKPLPRCIVTPTVAKHRLFAWLPAKILPDHQLIVTARADDTTFGILHSRFHETWSLRMGTWLGVGNDPRYTPTTTFETFPFPEGMTPNIPAASYVNDLRAKAIADAAKRLDDLRNAWLNPPEFVRLEAEVVPGYPDRILPKDVEAAAKLRERTLTKLYNQRPQWLQDAHRDLDAAVAAAYGWPADVSDKDALTELLDLNLARAGVASAPSRGGYVVGREASEKISAVEGIRLSDSMKETFAELDAEGSSDEERRRSILRKLPQLTRVADV